MHEKDARKKKRYAFPTRGSANAELGILTILAKINYTLAMLCEQLRSNSRSLSFRKFCFHFQIFLRNTSICRTFLHRYDMRLTKGFYCEIELGLLELIRIISLVYPECSSEA